MFLIFAIINFYRYSVSVWVKFTEKYFNLIEVWIMQRCDFDVQEEMI